MGDSILFDLRSSEFADYPYPLFARLRAEEGLVRGVEGWVASRHSDVVRLLTDDRLTSRGPGIEEVSSQNPIAGSLLSLDPPDHTRVRATVAPHFSPRAIDGFAAAASVVITRRAAALRETAGPCELVGEFATPASTEVIGDFVGVPDELRDALTEAINLALPAQQERLCVLSEQLLAEPRGRLQRDVVDAISDGRLTRSEAIGLVGLVLFAGQETTTGLIANAVVHLSEHPDLHRQMRANSALVRPYVEELVRLDSPVQHIGRWAADDINFGNTSIKAGDPIVLLPGAANRDDAAWHDANELKLTRSRTSPHIAFGWGRHYCLGAALARVEAELAVRALVNTFETFTVLEAVEYRKPANVRCPRRLLLARPG